MIRRDGSHTRIALRHRSLVATLLAVTGLLQFVSCVSMAAISAPDFEFGRSFLSTLGVSDNSAITVIGVRANTVFNTSVVLLGGSLILFFVLAFDLRTEATFGLVMFLTAGCCSALGLIGIGLTPMDVYLVEHNVFLAVWLLPMTVMVLAGVPVIGVGEFGRGLALLAALGVVAATAFFVFTLLTDNAPAMQAVVILASCTWLLLVCCHVVRAAVFLITEMRHGNDRATRQYLRLLENSRSDQLFDRSAARWDPARPHSDER